jgi:hypothetical protein
MYPELVTAPLNKLQISVHRTIGMVLREIMNASAIVAM